MKNLLLPHIDKYRRRDQKVIDFYGNDGNETAGMFLVGRLLVIASAGDDWDHVSVSRADTRDVCPTWDEMEKIKRLFFEDWETALQYHVPPADHVSVAHNCLHLWRPQTVEIPRPPVYMVA